LVINKDARSTEHDKNYKMCVEVLIDSWMVIWKKERTQLGVAQRK